jgi:hypothetical protein
MIVWKNKEIYPVLSEFFLEIVPNAVNLKENMKNWKLDFKIIKEISNQESTQIQEYILHAMIAQD